MGFRTRVREYVRSLTSRRRVVNFSASVPPPSSLPGTALSPISEESPHLREDFSTSDIRIPYDGPRRTTPLEDSTSKGRVNRTRFQLPTDSSPEAPPTPSLHSDQYSRLGPSKCFIVPAGRDDYLVRILQLVHLGDVESARPDEIKFSAPNSYYAPKIGHCVLLQCGYQQYIARVLLKISADQRPDEFAFRARDPHDEKSISRILDEVSPSPQPIDPNASTTDSLPSFEAAIYTPSFNDMSLLRTPAQRIGNIRQRSRGSLDSSTSNSSNCPVLDSVVPQENNLASQDPSEQTVSEGHTNGEPVHLEAGGQAGGEETEGQVLKIPRQRTPEGERPQEQEETDIASDSEQMAYSLDDLKNLQRFESPYVPSSGESSGWNTPRHLPHSPPRPPRMPNGVLLPPRMYVHGWGSHQGGSGEISDIRSDEEQQQRFYALPPPGFVPYHRVPPQFPTPTRSRNSAEYPETIIYYDPNANFNVRFSDYASVRVHERPEAVTPSARSPAGSSSSTSQRRSTTIPLPPSPTSPEPVPGSSTNPEGRNLSTSL